jgi:lipoate synthase
MHRNLRKVVGTLALTTVTVLGVAACGSSDNGSSSGDVCTYAKQLERSMTPESLASPDKATFDKLEAIMSNVQASSPAGIKDDVATVAKNFRDVRAFFAQYDFDIAKLTSAVQADPSLTEKLQALNSDEFKAAGGRLDTYFKEKCGIQAGS